MRRILAVVLLLFAATTASAQTVSASRFTLTTGPCVERSGSGAPNGSVTGNVCDVWHDTSTGLLWSKVSGTGNTGWISWGSANVASMLVSRDAAGAFSMGALSATTGLFSASATTPALFGNGTGSALNLGGTGIAGCTTNPPSTANCEAGIATFASAMLEQQLATDPTYRTQWFVGTGGAQLNSAHAGAWTPLTFNGAPTQVGGGGFHVGDTSAVDPGLGNVSFDGFIGSGTGVTVPAAVAPVLYASQTTGWRITNDGQADFRYLYTDEMHAKKFIADVEIALLGGVTVTKSQAKLSVPVLVPAKGSIATISVKDIPDSLGQQAYESGDTVMIRQFSRTGGGLDISNACGVVTGYADNADGTQRWAFQRYTGTDGGAMAEASVTMPVDSLILDYGVSGSGYYEISAADGLHAVNAPYAQTVRWTGVSPCNPANLTVTSRGGQLKGITSTSEYGALMGTYASGSSGNYAIFSDQHAELHGVPLSLWNGATKVISLEQTTPYMSMGNPAPTSYSAGNGCWSGMDAGVFKWRCGDPSGTNLIAWNGSTLSVVGAITISGTVADANNALNLVGTAGATVVSGAARGALGIDAQGNPSLPHTAPSSGTGLFLGSDYMGYMASNVWKTYLDNAGNFYLGGTGGALQFVGATGALTISGTVTATAGHIGGWTIGAQSLTAGWGTNSVGLDVTGGAEPVFYAGSATPTSAPFRVSVYGDLVATNATITGAITATSGSFTGNGSGITSINGGNITAATVTGTAIAAHTIAASEIAANTITASQIASGTITGTQIAAHTIAASEIAAGTITADRVAAHTLTGYEIAGSTIEAWNIASHTITADQIAASTITADRLNVSTLSAITANLGAVTAGSINIGTGGGLFSMAANGDTEVNNLTLHATMTLTHGTVRFQEIYGQTYYACIDSNGYLFGGAGGC